MCRLICTCLINLVAYLQSETYSIHFEWISRAEFLASFSPGSIIRGSVVHVEL